MIKTAWVVLLVLAIGFGGSWATAFWVYTGILFWAFVTYGLFKE